MKKIFIIVGVVLTVLTVGFVYISKNAESHARISGETVKYEMR